MLKTSLITGLLILAISWYIPACQGQDEPNLLDISMVTFDRATCPTVTANSSCGPSETPTQEECISIPACCWNDERTPSCYANIPNDPSTSIEYSNSQSRALAIDRPDEDETQRFSRSASIITDELGANNEQRRAILSEANTQSRNLLALAATGFPMCGVPTPMCYRVQCNAVNPASETNPLQCLNNPRCCFDQNLFLYRAIFGRAFMGGAPVCYFGPTSRLYQGIVQQVFPPNPITGVSSYNPFFQSIIVRLFNLYIDTGLAVSQVFQCQVTGLISRIAKDCGWGGITETACYLKGCCYLDNRCVYPNNNLFSLASAQPEYYPELIETDGTCSSLTSQTFRPSIYRRLPCAQGSTLTELYANCLLRQCCFDIAATSSDLVNFYGLIGLSSNGGLGFSSALGGGGGLSSALLAGAGGGGLSSALLAAGAAGGGGGLNPALLALSGGFNVGNTGDLLNLIFCPYRTISIPGFPDLSSSVQGCCNIQACYHATQGITRNCQWSQWAVASPCNARCETGNFGQQLRRRSCFVSGTNSVCRTCPGPSSETTSCQATCGSWGAWSVVRSCDAQCGSRGTTTRRRSCLFQGRQTSGCPGNSELTTSCQGSSCCQWSNWGQDGQCNAPCGQPGQQTRLRRCLTTAGGFCSSCPGPDRVAIPCSGPPCCQWSNLNNVGQCNAPCGQPGQQTRFRRCLTNAGGSCSSCPGSDRIPQPCSGPPCCQWSNWGQVGQCNAQCGRSGQRIRSRSCLSTTGRSCSSCPGSDRISQPCSGPPCCQWSNWGQVGQCNAQCGRQGERIRSRSCLSTTGGPCSSCPGADRTSEVCSGPPCFNLGDWTTWSFCGNNCRRERRRYCLRTETRQAAVNDMCGRSVNTDMRQSCSGDLCLPSSDTPWATWGNWMDWSPCSAGCGGGTQFRERSCFYRGRSDSYLPPSICQCAFGSDALVREERPCNQLSCFGGGTGGGGNQPCIYSGWGNNQLVRQGLYRYSRTCTCNGREVDASACSREGRAEIQVLCERQAVRLFNVTTSPCNCPGLPSIPRVLTCFACGSTCAERDTSPSCPC